MNWKSFCILLKEQTSVVALTDTPWKTPGRPRGPWPTALTSTHLQLLGWAWPVVCCGKSNWTELTFSEYLYLNKCIFFSHCGWTAVNKSASCFLMQNTALFEREDREYPGVLEASITTAVIRQGLPTQWVLYKMGFWGCFRTPSL